MQSLAVDTAHTSGLPSAGVILGRTVPTRRREAVGFGRSVSEGIEAGGKLIVDRGDSPLITIGATGRGKTSGPVVSNALTYPGSLILVDVKGEAARLTADKRRAMGQSVHILDLRDGMASGDSLNPLDIADMLGDDLMAVSRSMAAEIIGRNGGAERDPFWNDSAETMISAGIAYQLYQDPDNCRLSGLFDLYAMSDNVQGTLANYLSTTKGMNRTTQSGWSTFCQLPESNTRPCVLATTTSHLRVFDSDLIRRLTDRTTIDLKALRAGEAITIYVIVPPHRIKAYAPLLRLWITMLMHLLATRETAPAIPTLMIVDEAAQLGKVDSLEIAMTLMRGSGLRIWTFWQSVSQLEIYGSAAKTMLDNAGTVQVLGVNNARAAKEIVDILGGITADELVEMSGLRPPRQLLAISGRKPRICRQLRYFDDPMFGGE